MLTKDSISTAVGISRGEIVRSRIRGVGELADLIRSHPWHQTSLGSIEAWPPELLTAVNIVGINREWIITYLNPKA